MTPPMVLHGLGRATIALDGDWQFREGDDLAWASPDYNDSSWQPIQVGQSWESQGHRDYTGFAWYRRRLVLGAGNARDWTLAVYLPDVDSACEVYWNGVKKGAHGKLPPNPVWYGFGGARGQVVVLGPAESGELAIRVWKAPIVLLNRPEEGGLVAVPVAGSAEAIAGVEIAAKYQRLRAAQLPLWMAGLATVLGAMALLLWLRNRKHFILLWLSLAMMYMAAGYLLLEGPVTPSFRVGYAFIEPLIAIYDLAIWFLLIDLLGLNERKRLVRWTRIIALTAVALELVDTVCQFFDWTAWPPHRFLMIDVLTTLPAIYMELWGLVVVFAAFGKRLDIARWTLAIAALLSTLLTALQDMTGLGKRWTHWTLGERLHGQLFTLGGYPVNLQLLVNTFLLISILYAAWHYLVEYKQRQSALEQEMRNARAVQQVLIPDEIASVPGFKVESVYKSAGEVGGDFFQILPTTDNGVLLVIGDVSGKGMPAAMTVSLLVGTLGTLAQYTLSPGEILTAMNRRMVARSRGGFTTCLVMRIDGDGSIIAANAGHLPPYRNGEEIYIENGLPLGVIPDVVYLETKLQLEPSDILTLLSDGVLEARNLQGELFGFERTKTISREPAEKIARIAQAFGQEDDITVLTLRFAPGGTVMERLDDDSESATLGELRPHPLL
jgi:phosphoserine phosphatase RsbU/P